jgi:hypothetical protein
VTDQVYSERHAQGDTEKVEFDRTDWEHAVRTAAVAGDQAQLAELFSVGKRHFGAEVGHEWARLLSALDAGAITG